MLAAMTLTLAQAIEVAKRKAFVILDGTLLRIDRVGVTFGYDRAFCSTKHKAHGLNVQVIADPIGRLVWISPPLPEARHDMGAARVSLIRVGGKLGGVVLPDAGKVRGLMTKPSSSTREPSRSAFEDFKSTGYLGPVAVYSRPLCRAIVEHFERDAPPAPEEWWKGHAVTDRFVFDIATRDDILTPVKTILGPNIVLWGTQYIRRTPGQEHPWHADIETEQSARSFVSVWVGLANATKQSGLKFVAGSHLLGKSIQQVASEHGIARKELGNGAALALAQEIADHTFIDQPAVGDGDAIFFTGGVWHTSLNATEHARSALLLQFVTSDVPVRIPDLTDFEWPFKLTEVRAPSVLVAGSAGDSVHDLRSVPERFGAELD